MLLEFIDKLHGIGQVVGKTFGFLDASEATDLDVWTDDGRHVARFTSPDAGWPAMDVELPPDTQFEQAMTGALSRSGIWMTAMAPEDVRGFLERSQPELRWRRTSRGVAGSATPVNGVTLSVSINSTGRGTMIALAQKRPDSALKLSMEAKLRGLRDRRPA